MIGTHHRGRVSICGVALAAFSMTASSMIAPSTNEWPMGASTARARVGSEFPYPYQQLWQSAVRLVRVDMGMPITDRDESNGYLVFEYADGNQARTGSIELVRLDGENERVRVSVQVSGMPSYVERMILDRLNRKVHDEYGEPRRPVRTRPTAPSTPAETPPAENPPLSQ